MIDAFPVTIQPIPWTGDGPSVGIGNSDSDQYWGEKEMITGNVIIQNPRAPAYPYYAHHQELAGPVFYPGAQMRQVTTGRSQQALPQSLTYNYQDMITPIGSDPNGAIAGDIALGAPGVPTGTPFIGRA